MKCWYKGIKHRNAFHQDSYGDCEYYFTIWLCRCTVISSHLIMGCLCLSDKAILVSTALQIIAMLVLFPLELPCQTLYMSEHQNMFWETLFEHEKGFVWCKFIRVEPWKDFQNKVDKKIYFCKIYCNKIPSPWKSTWSQLKNTQGNMSIWVIYKKAKTQQKAWRHIMIKHKYARVNAI